MTEEYLEELIEKYADGSASEEEVSRLLNWYHAASINEVQWPVADTDEHKEIRRRILQRLQKEITTKPAKTLYLPWLKAAAVFILIIGAGVLIARFTKSNAEYYTSVTNPSGKIQLVPLPDNSKVWLNAGTELRYATVFTKNRKVQLKGEAYFEVTKDTAHPFSVTSGNVQTTVTGTVFNIKAYETDGKTTISVTDGSVKVANDTKDLAVLKPAMQLRFDEQTKAFDIVTIDTSSVIAWRKGRLQFEGESLGEIARTLERWYAIKIVFTDAALRNCRYYMGFTNTTPLNELLAAIGQLTAMKYTFNEKSGTVTFSGKGCP